MDLEQVNIRCDNCGEIHVGTYSHEGQFNQGSIYEVVCPVDDLSDYYNSRAITHS